MLKRKILIGNILSFLLFIGTITTNALVYGNGICEEGETVENCPDDCKIAIGVAFGSIYENQNYIDHIHNLGVQHTHINIWWHETEPSPGNYNYEFIDSFMDQLTDSTIALLRITTRYNVWATSDSKHTVPNDLTVGGPYYNYVYNAVSRTNGTVKYFENNWEADYNKHWNGIADQYAELTRTFYQAVKDADPDALVIYRWRHWHSK